MNRVFKRSTLIQGGIILASLMFLLFVISIYQMRKFHQHQRDQQTAKTDLKCLRNVMDLYREETGQRPASLEAVLAWQQQSEVPLETDRDSADDYQRAVRGIDPWGRRYQFKKTKEGDWEQIQLFSKGRNPHDEDDDIIVPWP